jgi:hypothetical protein
VAITAAGVSRTSTAIRIAGSQSIHVKAARATHTAAVARAQTTVRRQPVCVTRVSTALRALWRVLQRQHATAMAHAARQATACVICIGRGARATSATHYIMGELASSSVMRRQHAAITVAAARQASAYATRATTPTPAPSNARKQPVGRMEAATIQGAVLAMVTGSGNNATLVPLAITARIAQPTAIHS